MRKLCHHIVRRYVPQDLMKDRSRWSYIVPILSAVILLFAVVWSCWPTMIRLYGVWRTDNDYSAGQLVPLVVVFLIWRERNVVWERPPQPCWSAGITLILLAQALRIAALFFVLGSVEVWTLVLTAAGLVLLVGGWYVFRRLSWALLFLLLMLPLPMPVHNAIAGPLQRLATTGSVFLLEAFGISVSQQGNVVMLGGVTPLAVAEACSGLRMLMAFIIVAAFIAYMIRRPRWMKGALLVSSIPVAVVCNMVRISATAILMLYVSAEVAQKFFHDFAGYVMMPVAVMLLFGQIWLMDRIVVPDGEARPRQGAVKAKPARPVRDTPSRNVADCA